MPGDTRTNLTFSPAETAPAGTKGRALDHIGFEVDNLEAFLTSGHSTETMANEPDNCPDGIYRSEQDDYVWEVPGLGVVRTMSSSTDYCDNIMIESFNLERILESTNVTYP